MTYTEFGELVDSVFDEYLPSAKKGVREKFADALLDELVDLGAIEIFEERPERDEDSDFDEEV